MKRMVTPFYLLSCMLITVLCSCGSNISQIPHEEAAVEIQKTYHAAFEKVWSATQRALSESSTFKVLDKSSGIMVTEFSTIESKELSLFQTAFLGKTYKGSYTVNFVQDNPSSTVVSVSVKLEAVQYALLSREESNKDVEAYLRKKLFDRISSNLGRIAVISPDESHQNRNIEAMAQKTDSQNFAKQASKITIAQMQQCLIDLGYQPGSADGVAGKRTIDALKKYQRDKNLPVTGDLDGKTSDQLRNDL